MEVDKEFYWDMIISLEERKEELESQLPNVPDAVFEEYCLLVDLLGRLYEFV